MAKKKKIRADFRKNRNVKPRSGDFTRTFAAESSTHDDTAQGERVSGKGELTRALELAEKSPRGERWLWEAHRLLARALGDSPAAITHWEEFLRQGPLDSPYRREAQSELSRLKNKR